MTTLLIKQEKPKQLLVFILTKEIIFDFPHLEIFPIFFFYAIYKYFLQHKRCCLLITNHMKEREKVKGVVV